MRGAADAAQALGAQLESDVDSIYLGGGTPTVLSIDQLRQIFVTVTQNFRIVTGAETTVECAPGTLTDEVIAGLLECGVNRVSLGVQSFVDKEANSVGRLHKRETVLEEIARLRAAGLTNINVDLIAGLPHQTRESWDYSLNEVIGTGVPHVSVYMLEIDQDSRLGRELIAGGTKYHAHFVPDEDLTADLYVRACEKLQSAEIRQYEISNFARPGLESRHNLKYWTRKPYLGFGVDAHSMLHTTDKRAIRFSTLDVLEKYIGGDAATPQIIDQFAALEEEFFLGLRLNSGVDLRRIAEQFGSEAVAQFEDVITELTGLELLEKDGAMIRLTPRGRLLSNEVFERFITSAETA
jgi:oxygen-independent coproporphyrinogen-3 oxidase